MKLAEVERKLVEVDLAIKRGRKIISSSSFIVSP